HCVCGYSTPSCTVTHPPATQTVPTQTESTNTSIALKWNPSTDNVGVVDYGVRVNDNEVATPTQTSYTFTGLACGSSYSLSIAAYDAAGNHSVSGAVTMATSACAPPPTGYDTTPPTVPTNGKV